MNIGFIFVDFRVTLATREKTRPIRTSAQTRGFFFNGFYLLSVNKLNFLISNTLQNVQLYTTDPKVCSLFFKRLIGLNDDKHIFGYFAPNE